MRRYRENVKTARRSGDRQRPAPGSAGPCAMIRSRPDGSLRASQLDPMAESFHPVARLSEIPKKQCRSFRVAGSDVVVAHTAHGFYAVEDLCTHAEARLSHGRLK